MKRIRENHPYDHWIFQICLIAGFFFLAAQIIRGPTSWDVRLDTTYEAKSDHMGILIKHKWWGLTEKRYPIRFSVDQSGIGTWYYYKNGEWYHIPHGKFGRRVERGVETFSSDW